MPRKSGKNGYLQVKNIAAPNLDTPHTFTVTDGTNTYTVTASALSYAYTSVKNGDSDRQNLGKALYHRVKVLLINLCVSQSDNHQAKIAAPTASEH